MDRPVAMVTGSNRNTGLGLIRAFGWAGYDLVAACRTPENAAKTENLLKAEFPEARVKGVWFDQGKPDEIFRVFGEIAEQFDRLDVLVCNATVTGRQTFLEITPGEMTEIMNKNVGGYLFCAQAAAKMMISRRKGSIIMMSSVQSMGAVPRMMAYAASKAAINSLSRSIAIEVAKYGIRCNAILAGAIRVDKWASFTDEEIARKRKNWPLERESTPEEIAQAVLYLADDRSATVTGTELTVDSGVSMCLLPYDKHWEEG